MPPPPPIPYRRLRGMRWFWGARARAWLAPDHLLYVETSWFVERYRRFHLRDIEAVVLQRNDRARVATVLWIIALLPGLVMLLIPDAGPGTRATGAVLAALSLIGQVVHLLRGPCCSVTLHTRVSRQRLRCWNRVGRALPAVDELCEAVEAAQGRFSPADFETASDGASQADTNAAPYPPAAATPPAGPASPAAPGAPPAPAGLRWHVLSAAVLLVEAAAAAIAIGVRAAPMLMGTLVLSFILFGFCATALVRGAARRVPQALRTWAWWLFGYLALRGTAAYVWGMARYMPAAAASEGQPQDWVVLFFDSWAADSRFLAVFFAAISALSAVFGSLGFLLLRSARTRPAGEPKIGG